MASSKTPIKQTTRGWGRAEQDAAATATLPPCFSLYRYANGEEYIQLQTRDGAGRQAKDVKSRFYASEFEGSILKARKAAEDHKADLDYGRRHGVRLGGDLVARPVSVRDFLGDLDRTPPVYGEFWTSFAFNEYEHSTLKGHLWAAKSYLLPAFGNRLLREIRAKDLNDFKAYMLNPPERGGLARTPSTVIKVLNLAGAMFRYAESCGYVDEHPMHGRVRRPGHGMRKLIDPKSPETIEQICAQMTFKRATFVRTLAYQSLRIQEGLALTYGDFIDERFQLRPYLIVNKAIKPSTPQPKSPVGPLKTHRHTGKLSYQIRRPQLWRPIGEDVYSIWEAENRPPLSQTVWAVDKGPARGQPWRTPGMWGRSHWRTGCERAGVPFDELKNLRHVGACLLMVGPRWDFTRIAAFMGNSPEVCAARYVHLVSWADQYADMEIEDVIRSVRTAPAAGFLRHLAPLERPRTNIDLLHEAMGL